VPEIRVLLVDDHELVREGLKITFQFKAENIVVVGEAADGTEAVRLADELQPDLILMDIVMHGSDGVEATRLIVKRHPGIKVLMLTTYEDEHLLLSAMQAGASGYLLKEIPGAELVRCVERVMQGSVVINGPLASTFMQHLYEGTQKASVYSPGQPGMAEHDSPVRLTDREREILKLIVEGKDNQEIAGILCLSGGTVRNYVSQIYERMGVRDRGQAVKYAFMHGLVSAGKALGGD